MKKIKAPATKPLTKAAKAQGERFFVENNAQWSINEGAHAL